MDRSGAHNEAEVAEPWSVQGSVPSHDASLVKGSLASLAGETHSLRRRRLAAAALFLALAFAAVLVWRVFSFGLEGLRVGQPGRRVAFGSPSRRPSRVCS